MDICGNMKNGYIRDLPPSHDGDHEWAMACTPRGGMRRWMDMCQARDKEIARLREGLENIRDHPHNMYPETMATATGCDRQYAIGVADGHRCAAKVARAALAHTEPGGDTP